MTSIHITVRGHCAKAMTDGMIIAGTVGLPVTFDFDAEWDGLTKTAVFKAGGIVRDRIAIETATTVPHEVLSKPYPALIIGVQGTNADGTVVIPTVWAFAGLIVPGADPSGDPGADPTLPVWQDIQNQIDDIPVYTVDWLLANRPEGVAVSAREWLGVPSYQAALVFHTDDNKKNPPDGVYVINPPEGYKLWQVQVIVDTGTARTTVYTVRPPYTTYTVAREWTNNKKIKEVIRINDESGAVEIQIMADGTYQFDRITEYVDSGYFERRLATKIPSPETAEVGQILAVEAVDDDGKPVSWAPVDPAGGAGSGAVPYDNLLHANMEYVTLESDVTVNLSWAYPGWNGDPAQELSCALTEGMKYTVTWDGVEYKDLICVRDESVSFAFPYYLGDPILYSASNSITDSYAGATPFFISNNGGPDNRWSIWAARGGNHTFSISVLQPDKISAGDIDCTTFIQSDFEENDRNAVSYIKNRTHYDSRQELTYTFDGVLEGKEYIDAGNGIYQVKVSNDIPSDLLSITAITEYITLPGTDESYTFTREELMFGGGAQGIASEDVLIVPEDQTLDIGDGDTITYTKGVWFFYGTEDSPEPLTVNKAVIAAGELRPLDRKYIPPFEELIGKTLVATGTTDMSTNAAAIISPAQDTPRLKAGKCYNVYVDGVLQYTATCDYGKLWEWASADEYLVLVDPRGSGKQKIAEYISDNQLFAVTNLGLPWGEAGLALEIYEVEQIPENHLKNAVTSVNGKKGNVTLSADDVGALPADTEIPKVPDTLPNPNALTVNGVTYDGSKEVNIDTKELPKVAEDDDGKILGVSGGAWGKMDFPSVGGGEAGGYYTPAVSQPEAGSMEISFDASSGEMPEVAPVLVALPQGEKGDTGPQGEKGDTGPQGEKGNTGADGYTPVKGVDYFTADDKNELVQAVLAALPAAEEGSF